MLPKEVIHIVKSKFSNNVVIQFINKNKLKYLIDSSVLFILICRAGLYTITGLNCVEVVLADLVGGPCFWVGELAAAMVDCFPVSSISYLPVPLCCCKMNLMLALIQVIFLYSI